MTVKDSSWTYTIYWFRILMCFNILPTRIYLNNTWMNALDAANWKADRDALPHWTCIVGMLIGSLFGPSGTEGCFAFTSCALASAGGIPGSREDECWQAGSCPLSNISHMPRGSDRLENFSFSQWEREVLETSLWTPWHSWTGSDGTCLKWLLVSLTYIFSYKYITRMLNLGKEFQVPGGCGGGDKDKHLKCYLFIMGSFKKYLLTG